MDAIDMQMSGYGIDAQSGLYAAVDPTADPMRAFKAASIDGRMPDFGEDPADFFANAQIERVPSKSGETDQYRFVRRENGRSVPVGDANGTEYRFRLSDLIRGAKE